MARYGSVGGPEEGRGDAGAAAEERCGGVHVGQDYQQQQQWKPATPVTPATPATPATPTSPTTLTNTTTPTTATTGTTAGPGPSETDALLGSAGRESQRQSESESESESEAEAEAEAEADSRTAWQRLGAFYHRNIGLLLVMLAQTFGSIVTMSAKLLSTNFEPRIQTLQIIFVRMAATAALGSLYMWYKRVPDFPLGRPDVRGLLLLRGAAGFVGVSGSYYSLMYLDMSDQTVISFLVPTLTAIICFVALREPYTVREAMAGVMALTGVIFIARPSFLFSPGPDVGGAAQSYGGYPSAWASWMTMTMTTATTTATATAAGATRGHPGGLVPAVPVTAAQRAIGVVSAAVATLGAATAYATIRVIGARAHTLVTVNYFAAMASAASLLASLLFPGLGFVMPRVGAQWTLLAVIGLAGFLLQLLLTAGLRRERGGRATNVIYLQLVFALIIERVVWGTTPPLESLVGSVLIIGAAVWVSMQRSRTVSPTATKEDEAVHERGPLLGRSGSGSGSGGRAVE